MYQQPTSEDYQALLRQVRVLQEKVDALISQRRLLPPRSPQFRRPIRPVALWAMDTLVIPAVVSPIREKAREHHHPVVASNYPPVKRVRLIHGALGSQMVEAYDYDERRIPALCGPFEEVGKILLEIAGMKRWEEEFSPPAH